MLQGHGSSRTHIAELANRGAASLRLRLAVGIGLGVERLVSPDVADCSRGLVCEASKGERLANLEDLLPVDLAAKNGIAGRVCSGAVRGSKRLCDSRSINHELTEKGAE